MTDRLKNYTRREFLALTVAAGEISLLGWTNEPSKEQSANIAPQVQKKTIRPLIGATYWGGWFEGSEWANYLQDPKWIGRLPFFAKTNSLSNRVELNGNRPDIVNQEMLYAQQAGLDFLNFCYYHPNSQLSKYNYGLDLFLTSRIGFNLSYSLILQGSHVGDKENWSGFVDNLVRHFNHPKYQKVEGKRPLVSIFDIPSFHKTFETDYSKVKQALLELRTKTMKSGLTNPFIVAKNAEGALKELGFDAFGAYTANGLGLHREYPHEALVEANLKHWEMDRNEGRLVVPLVNFGWDPRPRLNHPVLGKDYRLGPWYTQPTPQQIQTHTRIACSWLSEHFSSSGIKLMDVYAWNELDEGGPGLIPTLTEGTSRIEAFRQVVEQLS